MPNTTIANPTRQTGAKVQPHQNVPTHRRETARVLLVEDEQVTAEVFARALQRRGHEVRVAKDGMQALHALRDFEPDVVVLDLGLPTVPGIEVLRKLRQSHEDKIPVVIVSGAGEGAVPSAGELMEPGRWLEKPLRPRDLVQAVDEVTAK